MGRRRMKTNGDEKETHLAETTATYALGVFCQLVNPYIWRRPPQKGIYEGFLRRCIRGRHFK